MFLSRSKNSTWCEFVSLNKMKILLRKFTCKFLCLKNTKHCLSLRCTDLHMLCVCVYCNATRLIISNQIECNVCLFVRARMFILYSHNIFMNTKQYCKWILLNSCQMEKQFNKKKTVLLVFTFKVYRKFVKSVVWILWITCIDCKLKWHQNQNQREREREIQHDKSTEQFELKLFEMKFVTAHKSCWCIYLFIFGSTHRNTANQTC